MNNRQVNQAYMTLMCMRAVTKHSTFKTVHMKNKLMFYHLKTRCCVSYTTVNQLVLFNV